MILQLCDAELHKHDVGLLALDPRSRQLDDVVFHKLDVESLVLDDPESLDEIHSRSEDLVNTREDQMKKRDLEELEMLGPKTVQDC